MTICRDTMATELTWRDIRDIVEIADKMLDDPKARVEYHNHNGNTTTTRYLRSGEMRPIVKIEECYSDETYTKEISILGVKVKTIIKTDKRSEKKETPIGFQTMNNILDHYPDV